MTVYINGVRREIPAGMTVEKLIEFYCLKSKSVALELNRQVVERNRFPATCLNENDVLEIVHFVGGG